jgi:hypothetical protein
MRVTRHVQTMPVVLESESCQWLAVDGAVPVDTAGSAAKRSLLVVRQQLQCSVTFTSSTFPTTSQSPISLSSMPMAVTSATFDHNIDLESQRGVPHPSGTSSFQNLPPHQVRSGRRVTLRFPTKTSTSKCSQFSRRTQVRLTFPLAHRISTRINQTDTSVNN